MFGKRTPIRVQFARPPPRPIKVFSHAEVIASDFPSLLFPFTPVVPSMDYVEKVKAEPKAYVLPFRPSVYLDEKLDDQFCVDPTVSKQAAKRLARAIQKRAKRAEAIREANVKFVVIPPKKRLVVKRDVVFTETGLTVESRQVLVQNRQKTVVKWVNIKDHPHLEKFVKKKQPVKPWKRGKVAVKEKKKIYSSPVKTLKLVNRFQQFQVLSPKKKPVGEVFEDHFRSYWRKIGIRSKKDKVLRKKRTCVFPRLSVPRNLSGKILAQLFREFVDRVKLGLLPSVTTYPSAYISKQKGGVVKARAQMEAFESPSTSSSNMAFNHLINTSSDIVQNICSPIHDLHKSFVDKLSQALRAVIGLLLQIDPCPACCNILMDGVASGMPVYTVLQFMKSHHISYGWMSYQRNINPAADDMPALAPVYVVIFYAFLRSFISGKFTLGIMEEHTLLGSLTQKFVDYLTPKGGTSVIEEGQMFERATVQGSPAPQFWEKSFLERQWSVLKSLLPGFQFDPSELAEAANYFKNVRSVVSHWTLWYGILIGTLVYLAKNYMQSTKIIDQEYERWVLEVDSYQKAYVDENGLIRDLTTDLHLSMKTRIKILELMRRGLALSRHLAQVRAPREAIDLVNGRLAGLRTIQNENKSLFSTARTKPVPFVMYVYGEPGVGKTKLVRRLSTDVMKILGRNFVESNDIYHHNMAQDYWDTYRCQPWVVFDDIFQLRDKPTRIAQADAIMRSCDGSAYPLNMADVAEKGLVYFSSSFVYMTSNVSPSDLESVLYEVVDCPSAFRRRLPYVINVSADKNALSGEDFSRSMRFNVNHQAEMTYPQFLGYIVRQVREHEAFEFTQMSLGSTDEVIEEAVNYADGHDQDNYHYDEIYLGPQTSLASGCGVTLPPDTKSAEGGSVPKPSRSGLKRRPRITRANAQGLLRVRRNSEEVLEWERQHPGQVISEEQMWYEVWQETPTPSPINHEWVQYNGPLPTTVQQPIFSVDPHVSDPWSISGAFERFRHYSCSSIGNIPYELYFLDSDYKSPFTGTYICPNDIVLPDPSVLSSNNVPIQTNIDLVMTSLNALPCSARTKVNTFIMRNFPRLSWAEIIDKIRDSLDYNAPGKTIPMIWTALNRKAQTILKRVQTTLMRIKNGFSSLSQRLLPIAPPETPPSRLTRAWNYAKSVVTENRVVLYAKSWIPTRIATSILNRVSHILALLIAGLVGVVALVGMMFTSMLKDDVRRGHHLRAAAEVTRTLASRQSETRTKDGMSNISNKFSQSRRQRVAPAKTRRIRVQGCSTLSKTIRANQVSVISRNYRLSGLFLKKKLLLCPLHLFSSNSSNVLEGEFFVCHPGKYEAVKFDMSEVRVAIRDDNHTVLIDLSHSPASKQIEEYPDISKHFVSSEECEFVSEGTLYLRRSEKGLVKNELQMLQITVLNNTLMLDVDDALVHYCWEYNSKTREGDCGSVLTVEVGDREFIGGLHIGGSETGRVGYSGICTKEDCQEMVESLGGSSTLAEEEVVTAVAEMEEINFPLELPELENPACIIEGKLPKPLMHLPSVSKLRPSEFQRDPTIRVPAVMRGRIYVDGVATNRAELFLQRSFVERPLVSRRAFNSVVDHVWRTIEPCKGVKKVLTLEQILFGSSLIRGLSSFDQNTGLGYPLCLEYKRKDLFSLEDNTINPLFRERFESFDRDLREGKELKTLMVDIPKDEPISREKIAQNKVRYITNIDFTINCLLKKYFGTFVTMLVNHHDVKPIKVGQNHLPEDCQALARYLHIGQPNVHYLAGDVKMSDRCIPVELFFYCVKIANRWYNDEYTEVRDSLAKTVFHTRRVCDKWVYRSSIGMPSGCYLTAIFNSMAYWMLLLECIPESIWSDAVVATYGDDHVVALLNGAQFSMRDLQKSLARYNIQYTTADKKTEMPDSILWHEVSFLCRRFKCVDGVWSMPMEFPSIVSMSEWWMLTPATKKWTQSTLDLVIVDTVLQEAVIHGKDVFNDFLSFFKSRSSHIRSRSFSYETMYKKWTRSSLTPGVEICEYPLYLDCLEESVPGLPEPIIFGRAEMESLAAQDETTVGSVQEDLEDYSLTRVDSLQEHRTCVCNVSPSSPADGWFSWSPGYVKELERLYFLDRITLNQKTVSIFPAASYSLDDFLFTRPYIIDRLKTTSFIRFDVEVVMRVVATKFHYGGIYAVIRPMISSSQRTTWFQYSGGGSGTGQLMAYYGQYDTLYTASTLGGSVISVTSDTSLSLIGKWPSPSSYHPVKDWQTYENVYTGRNFFMLDLYFLTPSGPTDIDPAQLVLYVKLKNVFCYGMAPAQKYLHPSVNCKVEYKPVTAFASMSYQKAFVESQATEAQDMEQPSFWDRLWSVAKGAVDVVRAVGRVATNIGNAAAWFGLSRPRDLTGPTFMAVLATPTGYSIGKSPALTTTYSNESAIEPSSEPENVTIEHVASTPAFITTAQVKGMSSVSDFKLSPTFESRVTVKMGSGDTIQVIDGLACPPFSYIARNFYRVRTGFKLWIHVYASAMLAVRVRVSLCPTGEFASGEIIEPQVISVDFEAQGETMKDIDIPYMFPDAWCSPWDTLWRVRVSCSTDVISPQESETRPVYIVFWLAANGFQVSCPATHQVADQNMIPHLTTNFYTPVSSKRKECSPCCALVQMGRALPRLGKPSDAAYAFQLRDIPTSLYHLMKRFCLFSMFKEGVTSITIAPGWSHSWPYLQAVDSVNYQGHASFPTPQCLFQALYKYYRGGFEYFFISDRGELVNTSLTEGGDAINKLGDEVKHYAMGAGVQSISSRGAAVLVPYKGANAWSLAPMPGVDSVPEVYFPRVGNSHYEPEIALEVSSSVTLYQSCADDYEMKQFIGCPLVYYAEIGALMTNSVFG